MIRSTTEFVSAVIGDLARWRSQTRPVRPWFRGESGNHPPLLPKIAGYSPEEGKDPPLFPKIAGYSKEEENYLLQSFLRKAGGIANTPPREHTDMWLFLAQHYGVPTRLLDWTEGALLGLYFAVNRDKPNPRVYMLHPHKLNELAGARSDGLNYPLTWIDGKVGYENIALAWEERNPKRGLDLPIAVPATYQDHRMIAQRSCFTVHGKKLKPLIHVLSEKGGELADCLIEYHIDRAASARLVEDLAILGVTGATIFPDLDHLAPDIASELGNR